MQTILLQPSDATMTEIADRSEGAVKVMLPEEVVVNEILTRLPVKSLVRFKCVSRRWMDLIQKNPSFISMHLTTMKKKKTYSYLLHNSCRGVEVCTEEWCGGPDFPYDILKLNLGPSLPYKPPSPYSDTNCFRNVPAIPYSIVGYCDGLFCLSWNHLSRYRTDNEYNQWGHLVIALCNPAIRQLRILPLSPTEFPPYILRLAVDIGFGFDPKTNDYKVVKMVMLSREEESSSMALDCIEVYSMATDSWRMILTRGGEGNHHRHNYAVAQNLKPSSFDTGICTSTGVLHWTMTKGERMDFVMASFHMDDDDSLRVTKLPSNSTPSQSWSDMKPCLSLLDDKPALIYSYSYDTTGEALIYQRVEIFLLTNYYDGEEEDGSSSWSLATVLDSCFEHIRPLGFWFESCLLIFKWKEQDNQFMLYDIATKQSMDVHQFTSERGFFYRESLVSVKRRGGCVDEQEENCCYSAVISSSDAVSVPPGPYPQWNTSDLMIWLRNYQYQYDSTLSHSLSCDG